jgi:hypothetical protein
MKKQRQGKARSKRNGVYSGTIALQAQRENSHNTPLLYPMTTPIGCDLYHNPPEKAAKMVAILQQRLQQRRICPLAMLCA